jgi:hypothetical protein
MLARIRKAVTAGLGAGIAAAVALVAKAGWHFDNATLSQALGAFVAAAAAVGWATWATPKNAPALAPYAPK